MSDPQPLSYESPQTTFSGVGIGTIALQLVGVYCFVLVLPIFTVTATYFGFAVGGGSGLEGVEVMFAFIPLGIYLALGISLIRFAARLSQWLFRDAAGGLMSGPVATPTGCYLQAVAFSVVGVVTMVNAAPMLAHYIAASITSNGRWSQGSVQAVQLATQFVLGLVLFLQSKGLAHFWHKLRTTGVEVHSESEKA